MGSRKKESAPQVEEDGQDAAPGGAGEAVAEGGAPAAPDGQEPLQTDLEGLQSQAAELQERVAELTDRLLRARADYENLKNRVERDAALEKERVKARVLEEFLRVFEYGRMAAQEAQKHPGPLAEGVRMVVAEFERLLEREGVRPVGAVGEPFDATRHEAVGEEVAAEGAAAPGCVSRVVAPGYLLGDRVLRYAKVMVAPEGEEGAQGKPERPGPAS